MRRLTTFALLLLAAAPAAAAPRCTPGWTVAWASSQFAPDAANALPPGTLDDATLRQTIRPTLDAGTIRLRLSNAFGTAPLRITAATVARTARSGSDTLDPATLRPLTFAGRREVVVPAGAEYLSDPVRLEVRAMQPLSVSLHFAEAPSVQTAHPGSRTTSHIAKGDRTDAASLPGAERVVHWYTLAAVEAEGCAKGAVVALGDSITDGFGTTTDGDDRWTDRLATRLTADPATRGIAVINQGIGGNRVLLDGLGPNALARLDRDVLTQPGVRWLVVLEGINDIGTHKREGATAPLPAQITAGYAQIVARARAHGIKVIGATILPFMGTPVYKPDAADEADRQAINAWIRAPGHFDAVVDLDRVMRDPARPDRLNPAFDIGDGLHPNPAGYRAMADAIPLGLFKR